MTFNIKVRGQDHSINALNQVISQTIGLKELNLIHQNINNRKQNVTFTFKIKSQDYRANALNYDISQTIGLRKFILTCTPAQ